MLDQSYCSRRETTYQRSILGDSSSLRMPLCSHTDRTSEILFVAVPPMSIVFCAVRALNLPLTRAVIGRAEILQRSKLVPRGDMLSLFGRTERPSRAYGNLDWCALPGGGSPHARQESP